MGNSLWKFTKPKTGSRVAKSNTEALKETGGNLSEELLAEQKQALETQYRRRFFGEIQKIRKEEKVLYNRQGREAEIQIKSLQQEVKALAKATDQLDSNVEMAVEQSIINPGQYHLSFLESLKTLIIKIRTDVENASIWLNALESRGKQKGHFWGTMGNKKKGGSGFLLSSEHYISRSAG
ncbi:MAG: DUF5660 family protein [Patescibacteria group bacterium]